MKPHTMLTTAAAALFILASCQREADPADQSDTAEAAATPGQPLHPEPHAAPVAKASDRSRGKESLVSLDGLLSAVAKEQIADGVRGMNDPDRAEKVRKVVSKAREHAAEEGITPYEWLARRENMKYHAIIARKATFVEIVEAFGTEAQRKFYLPD